MKRRFSAKAIRELRESRELSVKEFADKLGVSPQLVRNWEKGE